MAQKVNIVIDQGSTFSTVYTINDSYGIPMDLSLYTANSQMRKSYSSSNAYTFSASGNNSGVLVLSMNATTTNSITAGRYVYDIELTSNANSNITRIIEGIVTVTPQVTR
jgi:hypothetical protein